MPTKRRLLIVEDEEQVRRLIRRTFNDDFEIAEANDGLEAIEVARKFKPDIIITDQRMPKLSGVEFLSKIREELPNAIRVLVTGYTDYGPLVDAVNAAGVHHYFEKPFHTVDLRTIVDALVQASELEGQRNELHSRLEDSVKKLEESNRRLRDKEADLTVAVAGRTRELTEANTDLQDANRKLRDMAVRDGLTELFNHRCLIEHIELEVARSRRYGREFCLLFLDLDNFKQVNDSFGHSAGDTVLIKVADLLHPKVDGLRHSDFAARYGGEEFCVILPETPLEGGQIKAERIRKAVESTEWKALKEPIEANVTISIGVAAFPAHGDSVADILSAADAALYEAKRAGKNQVITGKRKDVGSRAGA